MIGYKIARRSKYQPWTTMADYFGDLALITLQIPEEAIVFGYRWKKMSNKYGVC